MRTLAVGAFDGIHLGHARVVSAALEADPDAVVVCFEPVPRQHFGGTGWRRRLTTPGERLRALRALGAEETVAVPFDGRTVSMTPEAFLEALSRDIGFDRLVIGWDFHFGADRSGSGETIEEWCSRRGADAIIVPPVEHRGAPVKSERTRRLLEDGDMSGAAELLGRPYAVTGPVSRGRGVGRRLGFPTLNLRLPRCKLLPPPGSYAAVVEGDRRGAARAAAFLPEEGRGPVEAHVIDRSPAAADRPVWGYGESVSLLLLERLRGVSRGLSRDDLASLIAGDVERVRGMEIDLSAATPGPLQTREMERGKRGRGSG